MDQTSITTAGAIDTFLVLLIGVGPKLALVPFLELTAPLDRTAQRGVLRKMLTTAATAAVVLMDHGVPRHRRAQGAGHIVHHGGCRPQPGAI